MSRLLLLLMTAGVGALFVSTPTMAQSGVPVTYAVAGATVVDSILGADEVDFHHAVGNYNSCGPSGFSPWQDVEWTTSTNIVYSGRWRAQPWCEFARDNVERFYELYCETNNRSDCGRLRLGNRPFEAEQRAETGTSLDEWWYWEVEMPGTWEFPPQDDQTLPGAIPTEFTCAHSDGRTMQWSSASWPGTGLFEGQTFYGVGRRSSVGGQWIWVTSGTGNRTGRGQTANQDVVAHCTSERPTLLQWQAGDYWKMQAGSFSHAEEHPDVMSGLQIIWAELLAENDRIGYPGLAIAGMVFDPLPTPEQLNLGEGLPGEGTPGDVDPGTCEDGWFLTQVVCEIRTLAASIWLFISHDAWVPQVNWSEQFGNLRSSISVRFPFNLFTESGVGLHYLKAFNAEQSEQLACQDINVQIQRPLRDGPNYVASLNLCDNAAGYWMHNSGRPLLVLSVALLMSLSLFRRLSTSL